MEKVIVTGATGFIGRQTIPLLKGKGFDVHAITSREDTTNLSEEVTWHSVDLFDYRKVMDVCREIRADNLLHLAWHDAPEERMTSPVNLSWVEASLYLIREFIERGGKRVVIAGSCAEYDWRYGYCSEQLTPTEPESFYGACKVSLNSIVEKYCCQMGVRFACGRIFFVYGPHEHESRLAAYVIRSLLNDQQAFIKYGDHIRDYLYVADVADALVKLLTSGVEGPVNIASGQPQKLGEMADLIGRKLYKPELIEHGSGNGTQGENPVVLADITRLRDELEWSPTFSLEAGIEASIEWWKNRNKNTKQIVG